MCILRLRRVWKDSDKAYRTVCMVSLNQNKAYPRLSPIEFVSLMPSHLYRTHFHQHPLPKWHKLELCALNLPANTRHLLYNSTSCSQKQICQNSLHTSQNPFKFVRQSLQDISTLSLNLNRHHQLSWSRSMKRALV